MHAVPIGLAEVGFGRQLWQPLDDVAQLLRFARELLAILGSALGTQLREPAMYHFYSIGEALRPVLRDVMLRVASGSFWFNRIAAGNEDSQHANGADPTTAEIRQCSCSPVDGRVAGNGDGRMPIFRQRDRFQKFPDHRQRIAVIDPQTHAQYGNGHQLHVIGGDESALI